MCSICAATCKNGRSCRIGDKSPFFQAVGVFLHLQSRELRITRLTTREVCYSTQPLQPQEEKPKTFSAGLVFEDQYVEISTSVCKTPSLYGLGASTRPDGLRHAMAQPARWAVQILPTYLKR